MAENKRRGTRDQQGDSENDGAGITPEEYQRLITIAEELKQEISESQGAFKELLKALKQDFKCSDVEAGEALLEKLRKQYKELNERLHSEKAKLITKLGDLW